MHDRDTARSNRLSTLLVSRHRFISFARYIVTGAAVFAIDFAIWINCVTVLGWDIRVSQVISRTAGSIIGFFGHKHFTFGAGDDYRAKALAQQGAAYAAGTVFNIFISPFVVYYCLLLVEGLPWSLVIGKVLAECILIVESYLLLRLIFRKRHAV